MATQQALNLERLPEHARNELIDFYSFLVKKYGRATTHGNATSGKAGMIDTKARFFEEVAAHPVILPTDYHFDRDELHER